MKISYNEIRAVFLVSDNKNKVRRIKDVDTVIGILEACGYKPRQIEEKMNMLFEGKNVIVKER